MIVFQGIGSRVLNRVTGGDFARPIVPYIGMVAPVQVENVFIIERTCY